MKVWVSALNMATTLGLARLPRFSETAVLVAMARRPRPRHDDAGRDVSRGAGAGAPGVAVGRGRHPEHAAERAAEGAEAREPHLEADLRHGPLGLAQQRHRALEPAALQVTVRRLAERPLERPDEVPLGRQGD